MKKLISILYLMLSSASFAGPSTSGGGFAVVCRSSTGAIESSELLDLYEGRTVHQFNLIAATGNTLEDYKSAVKNGYRHQGYSPAVSDQDMEANVLNFMKIVDWLPSGTNLPDLNDLGTKILVPNGCSIEPIAIFYDSQNSITINKDIWSSLNSLNQAALILHELYYHALRGMKVNSDTNSLEARMMTATDFSLNITPALSGIPSNIEPVTVFHDCLKSEAFSTSCGQATQYYKLPLPIGSDGKLRFKLQFTYLAGRPIKALTTLEIPQFVNYGDVYTIYSKQFATNWTATIAQDETRFGGHAVKLLIKRDQMPMIEIPL